MKANELMIGDWIQSKSDKFKMQVSAIFDDIVQVQTDYMRDGQWYSEAFIYDIEPIPLTPEILEKNGFKTDKYGQMVLNEELGTSEIYIVLQDGDECYWWVVSNELIAKIGYVHQLQRALKLCEIDKEIEL